MQAVSPEGQLGPGEGGGWLSSGQTEGALTPAHVGTSRQKRKVGASPGSLGYKTHSANSARFPLFAFSYQEILFLDLDKMYYYFK